MKPLRAALTGRRPQTVLRRLLASLRDIMAGIAPPQERLNAIVALIARELLADVCSVYVMRAGEVLELFATVGLRQEAVHATRLRVGEGIVGNVAAKAQPIALEDAPADPAFAYRPETGEDPFHGFCAAPILRGGRVRGVLVIQHRDRHSYSRMEVETLETVSMAVAEVLAALPLVKNEELSKGGDPALLPHRLEGTPLNAGMAVGIAVLHRPPLTLTDILADDPERELARLAAAFAAMRDSLDRMIGDLETPRLAESREILETYRLFAADQGWTRRLEDAIRTGLSAEAAVQRVQNETRAKLHQVTDALLRERLYDLDDLAHRLLSHLMGRAAATRLPDQAILIARSMGAAELLDYDPRRIKALLLEEGGPTAHVVIVAKAFDIPVIGRCQGLLKRVEERDALLVDAHYGLIALRPSEELREQFAESLKLKETRKREYEKLRDLPAVTADGTAISLSLNCGMLIEATHLAATAADGIGLYRSEIPFMLHSEYPDIATQTVIYRRIFDTAAGKPVAFRTLDVGGDKVLPYFRLAAEDNPALGWRALRIGLDRPALLRGQIRAALRAAQGRPLSLMFPMVTTVEEFLTARAMAQREVDGLRGRNQPVPTPLALGVMLEIPALLWDLSRLLERADFVAIGTNDLLQYFFAADRGHPVMGQRYDSLSPVFLSALSHIVEAARAAGKPLSVCGDMAAQPLTAMALLGLGIERLSMPPAALGPVKTMLRALHLAPLRALLRAALADPAAGSLRPTLTAFARDHGVPL